VKNAKRWFEERFGTRNVLREFLDQPLPERVGWPHVFGSMLLALTGLQFLTGLLLSFVYAPSPLSAYRSVSYMMEEMSGGVWLRGLHYWGASAIVILLGLHLIRTFVYAAYKRPREVTWILGALLLLCMLGFAQTGYLLPWDQKAYWGTGVTIRIAATIPLVGKSLAQLLRGGNTVGALTLSRFYSIHVIVLPLMTVFLIAGHIALIRRFGITAPWTRTGEEAPRTVPFYPDQMAKDSAAMLLILGGVMSLAWLLSAPLGNPADPADNTFTPRPDWYFLFQFQMLRYFEGTWEVVGTFLIPAGLTFGLIALPFLDRNPSRRLSDRKFALGALGIALSVWGLLTYLAVAQTPKRPGWQRPAGFRIARSERIKRPSEVGGLYVLKQQCFECHSMTVLGERSSLQTLLRKSFPSGGDWLQAHLQNTGRALTAKEVSELMSVFRLVAGVDSTLLSSIPPKARFGAHLFYNKACIHCHTIDGQGGKSSEIKGPDLTLRLLRPKEWHMEHIRDSQSLVPDSKMPPFLHYEDFEYEALAEYLLYLHTP